jgi:hypothetical protein
MAAQWAGYGPVIPADTHELAWAAGFWDGEGHVGARDNGRGHRYIHANVTQKDRGVLERLVSIVGGKIYPHTSGWNWQQDIGRDGVMLLYWRLWPWLSELKRAQFESAFRNYHALGSRRRVV